MYSHMHIMNNSNKYILLCTSCNTDYMVHGTCTQCLQYVTTKTAQVRTCL